MRKTSLDCVYQLAQEDHRVIFVGSDLGAGILDVMKREMPERWLMEGISEQHIIGMAAGLAMAGFVPYVNSIATFLTRRCYEQIVVDLCMHKLPVRIIANGGGAVYAPLGPTHQATEDLANMRVLPGMTVLAPCDASEMRRLMPQTLNWPGPIYLRLAKGGDRIVSSPEVKPIIGKGIVMRRPGSLLFVTTGVMAQRALEASILLEKKGYTCGVLHMHTVKPLDIELLLSSSANVDMIITIEEHQRTGGLGSAVIESLNDHVDYQGAPVLRLGIPDCFADEYGSQDSLLDTWNLCPEGITGAVENRLIRRSS